MKNNYQVVFENARFICECDAEQTEEGTDFYNILITDKSTGQSKESLEMPEGLLALAKAVAAAEIDE